MGQESSRRVEYQCLGHPAWPGNLVMTTEAEAERWWHEHKDTHPVYVVRVVSERVTILDANRAHDRFIPEPHDSGGSDG